MKQPKRIQVKETSRVHFDFEGKIQSIIDDLEASLQEGWEGIEVDYEYYYGDSQSHTVYDLYRFREENDKEYALRMKQLDAEKALKQAAKDKRDRLKQIRDKLPTLSEEELKLLGL